MTQFLLFLPVEVEKIAAFEFTKPVDNNYGQSLKKKHSPNYHANHNQHDDKNDQQDGHHAQDDGQETVYSQQK